MTFILFSRSHRHFETQILIDVSLIILCAHYIMNQWLEFYHTSTDTSLGHGKEVIGLVTLTSFSRSLHYKDSKYESCIHSISWINRWNLTKLAQILYWDRGKKRLDYTIFFVSFQQSYGPWLTSEFLLCSLSCELTDFYEVLQSEILDLKAWLATVFCSATQA